MKNQFDARFFIATADGVVEIDAVDYPDVDFLRFEDAISALEDGDVVFGMAAPEHFERLAEDYGIY